MFAGITSKMDLQVRIKGSNFIVLLVLMVSIVNTFMVLHLYLTVLCLQRLPTAAAQYVQ